MCGIIGVCGIAPDSAIDEALFVRARDSMRARGPDAFDHVRFSGDVTGDCLFGHRRLSIQDLSANGDQPMASACGRFTIVYNGEVYNTNALRAALSATGTRFRSTSDTEVVLEGYATWGAEVVKRLNGMFAFGIWDSAEHRLFLARDRIGIKPLYVATFSGALAFASDARALRLLGLGPQIDREAMALYLALGYVPAPRSIWSGIEKLDAGTTMTWEPDGNARIARYWIAPDDTDFEGTEFHLEDLVDEVVEEQLLSDVPLGLFLSGGLDSSVVASSIAGLGRSAFDVTALTVEFPGIRSGNEAPVAIRTARALGFELRVVNPSSDPARHFDTAVASMDEPLAYNAAVSQAAISETAAAAGFKSVLTGDGGDEVFGGYRWYDTSLETAPHGREVAGWLSILKRALSTRPWPRKRLSLPDRNYHAKSKFFAHTSSVFPAFRPDQINTLLDDMPQAATEALVLDAIRRYDAPNLPEKRRRQRIDLYTFCQDAVLAKVDRQGMSHSLEARPPLLDHRIVEWGISRPIAPRFDGAPKNILRSIVAKRGLSFLLDEPKRGFGYRGHRPLRRKEKLAVARPLMCSLGFRQGWEASLRRSSYRHGALVEVLYWLSQWHALQDKSASRTDHG